MAHAVGSALAANLECLGPGNADVARRLAAAAPADVALADTPQGVPSLTLGGAPLCSRHRPLDEADRLAAGADLIEHAVVVVLGFGAGYHVQRLAERLGRAGVIVVFEPDLGLLRAVLEGVDHASWLREANVLFVTDPEDRGALAGKLEGAESLIAQGVEFLEHPASRRRLGAATRTFAATFGEFVSSVKVTFSTTLMRSVDTVRNLLLNLDHYGAGAGIADLEGLCAGRPAVVVSAGPSLRRNLHLLADPDIRRRCVIIAAQTTLQPLLAAGVRPHFVTALDYHEISRRFYEDLDANAVRDVTLVADPKVHPVVLDVFPGPLRCCANDFLDRVLGEKLARPMGRVPAGATVAHLAVYMARFLGCNPIVLTGQDLAFTDGLYYAPGTAIDDVWAPELNPFNTIEMMQLQRILRHRRHLSRQRDVHGRSVYTDAQMVAYLQQFERDFARYADAGVEVIDATEGGLPKRSTRRLQLAEALRRHAGEPLPELPVPSAAADPARLEAIRGRVAALRRDVAALLETSRATAGLIERMLADQDDAAAMERHFRRLAGFKKVIDERFEAFEIVNFLNQLGVYKRFRADRRLHMQKLDGAARQRAQLQRDGENVTWTADAAAEIDRLLGRARQVLDGEPVVGTRCSAAILRDEDIRIGAPPSRVAALVPVDPRRNGLGIARPLDAPFAGRPVLQATLERLGRVSSLEEIILIAPRGYDVEALLDRARIGVPVVVEPCDGSPFGPEQAAIAAARLWSPSCWRGGIAGMSVYDEVLCPEPMSRILEARGLDAGLLAAPDWPLLDPSSATGCAAVVARHRELPGQHKLVFTQAPPGLGARLVATSLMKELAGRNRLSTVGGLLVYQPHAPQHDPIARSVNVQVDHRVSRSRIRATFDSARRRALLACVEADYDDATLDAAAVVARLERRRREAADELPGHVIVEAGIDPALARRLLEPLGDAGDAVLTLGGRRDPLEHEKLDELVGLARDCGVAGVHVRTALRADEPRLRRLLACAPEVISVDVDPARAGELERAIEFLLDNRRRLTDHGAATALALPWVVPRLKRCAATVEQLDAFFDRWQATLGTAVIDPPDGGDGGLLPLPVPPAVLQDERRATMRVSADGTVPGAGNLGETPVAELWARAVGAGRGP